MTNSAHAARPTTVNEHPVEGTSPRGQEQRSGITIAAQGQLAMAPAVTIPRRVSGDDEFLDQFVPGLQDSLTTA